jgi:Kdo2-lipid IVA lauroyltransferase/acyltransferase
MASIASRVGADQPDVDRRRPVLELVRVALGRSRHALFMLLLATASRLPSTMAHGVARTLGRIRHRLNRRRLTIDPGLVGALGATPEQVESWARRASELSACENLEAYLYPRLRADELDELIHVEGSRHLEQALSQGRGAILFSVHVRGQFAFFPWLAAHGYPPTMVGFPPFTGMVPFDRRFRQWRWALLEERFGCRMLWMGQDSFGVGVKAANVLRDKGVVVMFVDVANRRLGVEGEFLGVARRWTSGPALLAKTTGAPMLDFYVHRDRDWRQIAEIGAPLQPTESLEETAQLCLERLEEHVRQHPAQWKFATSYDGPRGQ